MAAADNLTYLHRSRKTSTLLRPKKSMLSPFALKIPFTTGLEPKGPASGGCWWFIFAETKLLIHLGENDTAAICKHRPEELGLQPIFSRYLGRYAETDCYVVSLDNAPTPPKGMVFRDLRSLYGIFDDDVFCLAGRAIQIVHWHREHRFCGRCGAAMIDRRTELARKCPNCNFISYPRLSPAVIMSVVRDDHILLARAPRFPTGMYSTLAGFVEPGETLEEAVCREVFEEVALIVDDVRYVASQPWPFPHSLMIGFSARYLSGEISIDSKELEDAQWFSPPALPLLPSKISISRLLIENFLQQVDKR